MKITGACKGLIEKFGVNPTWSRRCNREQIQTLPLENISGKAWICDELESEELPALFITV